MTTVDRRSFLRTTAAALAGAWLFACGDKGRVYAAAHAAGLLGEALPASGSARDRLPPNLAPAIAASAEAVDAARAALSSPQQMTRLAPAALGAEMARRYLLDPGTSRQDVEQGFEGRAFSDTLSGAIILLSKSAQRCFTARAIRRHFAGVYLCEEDFAARISPRVLIDDETGVTTLASGSRRESMGVVVPTAEEMTGVVAGSEHFRIAMQGAPDLTASDETMVIIDDHQGKPYVIFPRPDDVDADSRWSGRQTVAFMIRDGKPQRGLETGLSFVAPPRSRTANGRLRFLWSDARGYLCACDDYGAIAVYDAETSNWRSVPLDEDIPTGFGSRVRTTIRDSGRALGIILPDGTVNQNAVQLLPAGNATSGIFMVVGGDDGSPYGLVRQQPYAGWVSSAFRLLNTADPGIENTMLSYGVRAVAGDILPCDFVAERERSWAATFNAGIGVIEINQKAESTVQGINNVMATLLLEMRNVGFRRGLVAKMDSNQGVDKGLFVKSWAEAHRATLEPAAYDQIVYRADYTIAWYRKNLP